MDTKSQSDKDDKELIERYLNNEISAFDSLYEKYKTPLYSYLNKLLPGQKQLIDDIFQKTWLKIIDQMGSYKHESKFLSWVIRISHNCAIDHFRKYAREEIQDFQERSNLYQSDNSEFWKSIDNTELANDIENCVKQLAFEQKTVFLCRQQDISFREIAEIQKCSVNTVLGRMQYALRNLRECLAKWEKAL